MPDAHAPAPAPATGPAPASEKHSTKDTIVSLVIALAMALIFRAFVIEAFIIPTGSMAPTLMGAHLRFQSPESGYAWAVEPWSYTDRGAQFPQPVQRNVRVYDPMTGFEVRGESLRTRAGDRVLVVKYLPPVFQPERFDVIVFKNPTNPRENFIKRLIGLAGEEVALIDGDVFTRDPGERSADAAGDASGDAMAHSSWGLAGWRVARKPERVQRAVWQDVFDSRWTPADDTRDDRRWFVPPWVGDEKAGWSIRNRRSYRFDRAERTRLEWDSQRWPIVDRYAYNEDASSTGHPLSRLPVPARVKVYPVSDLRIAFGVEPDAPGLKLALRVDARGHAFQADIDGTAAAVRMRPLPDESRPDPAWTVVGSGTLARPLEPGRVTNVEFWHVDQSLQLWVDGRLVAAGPYDWAPNQRLVFSTGYTLDQVIAAWQDTRRNVLLESDPERLARVRLDFEGSAFTLHRVALQRDLHYQATDYPPSIASRQNPRGQQPGLATHPLQPLALGPDQFFACGDNSPKSEDGRMWIPPDRWVAEQLDPTQGVVPRDLLMGKAFFVYFPSVRRHAGVPIPDFGRLRFIW